MWTPLEIDDTFDLEALLSLQAHARQLVHADLLTWRQPRSVLVVWAPLERRPRHLFPCAFALGEDGGKRAQEVACLDVPDCDVVALVFGGEGTWAFGHVLRHNDRLVRPSDEILFAGRKVD